jgi:hypothetical protein
MTGNQDDRRNEALQNPAIDALLPQEMALKAETIGARPRPGATRSRS